MVLLPLACVPPEDDVEDVISYSRETTMGQLQREGEMTIALPDDLGPFSSLGDDGEPEGFVAELAFEIVADLGIEATYVPASGEEALELVKEGEVDLAFPTLGITEALARQNTLSDPYWIAHKRLLVPATSEVESGRTSRVMARSASTRRSSTRTDIVGDLRRHPTRPTSRISGNAPMSFRTAQRPPLHRTST